MPHVSLRVTEDERSTMESYAKLQGVNLSDAIKEVFFQKLEDEYDLQIIKEHKERNERGEVKYFTHEQVGKELGLVK